MRVIDATGRSGVAIADHRTVQAAAQIMDQAKVGALAVVDEETHLIGIVTDRDIVRRAVAPGLPPETRVDKVMSSPVFSVSADADLHDAFALFRKHCVRRLAIVRDGEFVGMITVDDMLTDMASDLSDLARPIRAETLVRA